GDILVDSADSATKTAKEFYMRKRPFVYFDHHTCQPEDEEASLRQNGSYPSGHTSYGWTLALILAQIEPSHAQEIIQRGYDFGQSRVICGAHWQSDVDAGRVVGAVEYSRLQSLPKFQEDLRKSAKEVNQQRMLLK
ncbi:MAG: phosphatase PAP2 family protein, partial [Acinetobacter sp.]